MKVYTQMYVGLLEQMNKYMILFILVLLNKTLTSLSKS